MLKAAITTATCIFFLLNFFAADGAYDISLPRDIYGVKINKNISFDHKDNDEVPLYNLSICAVFQNEAYHLQMWIEHHKKIGIDHIYLYNIGSYDPFFFVLIPYINEGFVTLVNWPGQLEKDENITSMRISAYENAIHVVARNESKWLLFLDIDEFLNCPGENIDEILEQFESCSGILLASSIVDQKISPIAKKTGEFIHESSNSVMPISEKNMAKMILKPDQCQGFSWPPYKCNFKEPESIVINANKKELSINRHINRMTKQEMIRGCIKAKKHAGFFLTPETNAAYLAEMEKTNSNELLDLPMYQFMPTFLKKLKSKYD